MSFGENLQQIRKKNQLSQEGLAEIAEIQAALEAGAASYTLQFSVKCKQNLLRTIIED